MVRPQELITAVIRALKDSGRFPNSVTYIGYEPDLDSDAIKLPIIEVSPNSQIRISDSNTDFVGYQYNDEGQEVGRIFEALYDLEFTVSIWTAHNSKYSPREMGNLVRDVLYHYESSGPANKLQYPDDRTIDEVWRFDVFDGAQTDNLTTTPPLRRWSIDCSISASERYITEAEAGPVEAFDLNPSA